MNDFVYILIVNGNVVGKTATRKSDLMTEAELFYKDLPYKIIEQNTRTGVQKVILEN